MAVTTCPTWTNKLTIKNKQWRVLFARRVQEITRDLIAEELGPDYADIRIEALSIASGEVSDYLEDTVSIKGRKALSEQLNSYIVKFRRNIDNDEVLINMCQLDPFAEWEF